MAIFLDLDPQQMRAEFNSRAFSFGHDLSRSPLFELARLGRLAESLFEGAGRRDVYNAAAGTAFGAPFTQNDPHRWSPARAIAEIESSGSWMVLKRVEQDPEYRELVDACLAELARVVPEFQPQRIRKAEGFIFVTSPGGITPYHIDPQWSFLAQIRGRKTYRIYDVLDPEVITAGEIEDYYRGQTMAARYDESKNRKAAVFELESGMCVNQPRHAPHSAEVGDQYSISFTVAIITNAWAAEEPVHCANGWLRKHGIETGEVGANRLSDALKSVSYRASVRVRHLFRDARDA